MIVGVGVRVTVGVRVGVTVGVRVGVTVGVRVGVSVRVGVIVTVGVGVYDGITVGLQPPMTQENPLQTQGGTLPRQSLSPKQEQLQTIVGVGVSVRVGVGVLVAVGVGVLLGAKQALKEHIVHVEHWVIQSGCPVQVRLPQIPHQGSVLP